MASCSSVPMEMRRLRWDLMQDGKIIWGESKRREGSLASMNYSRYSQSTTVREAIHLGARQGDLDYEHRKGCLSFEDGTVVHYFSTTPPVTNPETEDGGDEDDVKNSAVPLEAEAEDGKPATEVDKSNAPTLVDLKKSAGIAFLEINPKRRKTEAHSRFERYSKAKTFAEALELGASERDLTFDCKRGYVRPVSAENVCAHLPIQDENPGVRADAGDKMCTEVAVQVDLDDFKRYLRGQGKPSRPTLQIPLGFQTPPRRTSRGLRRSPG